MDLDEAAALLRVQPEIVRALAESQRIPARRVGDAWRFWHSALLEWLKGEQAGRAASELPGRSTGLDGAETLRRELQNLTAKGVGADPQNSQAPPQPPAQSLATPATPTVGERPSAPTTEEVALRDQRILLKRGAATIDFGASYGRSDQILYPVVRAEEKDVGVNSTLRYGLADDLQLTVHVPTTWRRTTTFADASISGTSAPRITTTPAAIAGDASVSLLGVAWREAVGRPTIVWSLDGLVPTGAGDRGVGGGLVLSKSYDPAVLFAGFTYMYGLHTNPSNSLWSLAKHNFGFQVGYTYAVNDTLALSMAFLGTYRNTRSPDGVAIPPPRENYALQLGTTWLLSRGLFMEPAVAMRLGGDNPGVSLSLNFSRSLRSLSKP